MGRFVTGRSCLQSWVWSQLIEDEDEAGEKHQQEEVEAGQQQPQQQQGHNKEQEPLCTVLTLEGLCCASEVPVVEGALQGLAGVQKISVRPAVKTVSVTHDPTLVTAGELAAALNILALGAREQQPISTRRLRPVPYRVVLAAILWLGSLVCNGTQLLQSSMWSALLSVVLISPKVLVRAAGAIRHLVLDMSVLISTACLGAIAIQSFCEAATVLLLFVLSDYFESWVTERVRGAIGEVLALRPEQAELASGGGRIAVCDVSLGAVVVVRQGDLVPLDGVVAAGSAVVDESALSGEPMPVQKRVGATVLAGTTNVSGYIEVQTTAVSMDSTVARLVQLLEQAQTLRSSTERLVERFARTYTPCVLTIALLLMTVPWLVKPAVAPRLFYITLMLFVISCPCALVISTPVTYLSGIACAATHNILVRGGVHLETLGRTDIVALDKTGTLTEGSFRVRDFQALQEADGGLWRRLAAVEARSSHPVAMALVAAARERGAEPEGEVVGYAELEGEGVEATVSGQHLLVGNEHLAQRLGWNDDPHSEHWAAEGGTVLWVGTEKGPQAVLSVSDACRPEARGAVAALQGLGMRTVMLTGDGQATAEAVGDLVGLSEIQAGLLPDDKIRCVLELCAGARAVAMVGDGINDVPALAASHVGIAMGGAGRAAALEAADVVLMDSDLNKLVQAFRIGRRVLWTVRLNVALAVLGKLAVVVCTLLGHGSLWGAVAADVGMMLLVTLNGTAVMALRQPRGRRGGCRRIDGSGAASGSMGDSQLEEATPQAIARPCRGYCCAAGAAQAAPGPEEPRPPLEDSDLFGVTPPPPPAVLPGNFCAGFGAHRGGRPRRPRAMGGRFNEAAPLSAQTESQHATPFDLSAEP